MSVPAELTSTRMTRSGVAIAAAAYSLIAVLLTFPLVFHLSSVVPHDLGDPLLSATILWWNAHVLPFTDRWWNGFAFYPAPGFMALSDHRLGESLLATPLQWLGSSPVTAYNVTLLATYPLSAIAAHWLGFILAKRHDAAAICGLSYGFSPYRVAHIQHLELLGAFGMPVALSALHRYLDTREPRWLVVFACALVLQGLSASYYLLFFSVFLGLWMWWFVRCDLRGLLMIGVAGVSALVALTPIAIGYLRIHSYYGLERRLDEIVRFSADITSVFTASPLLAVWGWMGRWARPEGDLFPGLTIAALALVGAIVAWRSCSAAPDRLESLSVWLLPVAFVFASIAFCAWMFAPWRFTFIGVRMSSATPFKPLSSAVLAVIAWVAVRSRVRAAYARHSTFAFYLIATALLLVCSFGPKPMLLGHQVLYQPPYQWLMRLPVFGSIRVPARFAMPALLALSVSGALAFNRFHVEGPRRRALAIAIMVGILADSWMRQLPLPAPPAFWPSARAEGFAAVLELPLGDTLGDMAAMYRVTNHGHPVVNGNSGFEPTHYFTLKTALEEHDPTALDGLPATRSVLIVVEKRDDPDGGWDAFLTANPRVKRLPPDDTWAFYAAAPPAEAPPPCSGDPLPIVGAVSDRGPMDLTAITDGNPHTFWTAPGPQRVGDSLVLDLGRQARPCAVFLSVGEFRKSYPRKLIVDTSGDGVRWNTVATRRTAGLAMQGALADPKRVTIPIPLEPSAGRFVRLRLDESHPTVPWTVTDVAIRNARAPE